MPDEADSGVDQSTPAPEQENAAPDQGTPAEPTEGSQPEVNWQERYTNQQGALTQAQQEAAQYRQILDMARQGDPEALEWLGIELAEDDEEDDDTDEFRDPRVDELLQKQQEEAKQREEQEYLDQLESEVESEIEKLAKSAGVELTDDEVDLIFGALTPGENGAPDTEAAFRKVTGLRDAHIESYRKSKKAPRVETGAAGTEKVDLGNEETRVAHMADLIEAGLSDEAS